MVLDPDSFSDHTGKPTGQQSLGTTAVRSVALLPIIVTGGRDSVGRVARAVKKSGARRKSYERGGSTHVYDLFFKNIYKYNQL